RLDEAVIGQAAVLRIFEKFVEEAEAERRIEPQLAQRRHLRQIVKIDAPAFSLVLQPVKDRRPREGDVEVIVVDMTGACSGVREEAVGPGLTRRRGVPLVADAEGFGE